MSEARRRVYWDACVFLTYIEEHPEERLPILDALLEAASKNEITIFTSVFSMTEVAYARAERHAKQLDPEVQQRIEALWEDRATIKLVEYHQLIAIDARDLIRAAVASGRSLRPGDAIHLATAERMNVAELQTYDERLLKFSGNISFSLCKPYSSSPRLFS